MIKNSPYKFSALILSLLVACLFIAVSFFSEAEKKEILEESYISFTGFDKDTNIEIVAEGINKKILIISDDTEQKISNLKFENSIAYTISKDNQFIDLAVIKNLKTNLIKARISGLKKGDAASLSNQKNYSQNLTPVDWSGKIILSQSNYKNTTCVNISVKKLMQICHSSNREVVS